MLKNRDNRYPGNKIKTSNQHVREFMSKRKKKWYNTAII